MKKYASLALAFVLTASLMVGCGCTNRKMDKATIPSTMPATQAATETTHATVPHTETTHSTEATIDHGNGPLEDYTEGASNDTTGTDNATGTENHARSAMPSVR